MPLFDLFWAMLWFSLLVMWIWLVISVFIDIFRSDDLSGWGKAGWTILVLVVPFLGVFIYVIARGSQMQDRAVEKAQARDQATQEYIRSAADTGDDVADEIGKLNSLHDQGVLTDEEFQAQKAKLLA